MGELRIASINVNGMRVATKRRCLFDRLRKGAFDLCLIQESHCTPKEAKVWKTEWGDQHTFAMVTPAPEG